MVRVGYPLSTLSDRHEPRMRSSTAGCNAAARTRSPPGRTDLTLPRRRVMLRNPIPSGILTTPALIGMAGTANASEPTILPHHHFEVLAKRSGEWKNHGVYHL